MYAHYILKSVCDSDHIICTALLPSRMEIKIQSALRAPRCQLAHGDQKQAAAAGESLESSAKVSWEAVQGDCILLQFGGRSYVFIYYRLHFNQGDFSSIDLELFFFFFSPCYTKVNLSFLATWHSHVHHTLWISTETEQKTTLSWMRQPYLRLTSLNHQELLIKTVWADYNFLNRRSIGNCC